MMQSRRISLLFLLLFACEPAPARQPTRQSDRQPAPPHGDTITIAMREALDRFRTTVEGPPPATISGGAASRDELVRRFAEAVERADTAALIRMTMNRAEFAYLHYPHSIYTRPPYELDADHAWLLAKASTEKGLTRILRRFGGSPFRITTYQCPQAARRQGPNRFWDDCTLTREIDGRRHTMRWFGSIWERDGQFKFGSYANDL